MRFVDVNLMNLEEYRRKFRVLNAMFVFIQVMHVLGFDPHAFAHFRDERKRRRSQVITWHLL